MICPNCGKELLEGEVCSCTAANEPVQNTEENNYYQSAQQIQEPIQEPVQEPIQEPAQQAAQGSAYQQPQQNAYYSPEQPINGYYDPNAQQIPYYAPIIQPVASTDYPEDYKPKKKYVAVILAATLGVFGIHNFYLGNSSKGVAQLLLTLLGSLFFGLGLIACNVWAIFEAVQILIEKIDSDANGYKIMTFAEELALAKKDKE